MTRRNRTLRTVAASLLLAALMTTAACGAESKSPNEDGSAETINTGIPEETANGSGETGAIDTGTATPEGDGQSPLESGGTDQPAANDPAPKQAEGNFNGLADSHSAEITTPDGTFVYQLGDGIEEQVAALEENAKIRFEYIEKSMDGGESQRWLTKVEGK